MTTYSVTEHLWSAVGRVGHSDVLHIDLSPHPAREAEALLWLDEQERRRADRFTHPGPRRRFTLCRAALRALLCESLGCSNEELSFKVSEHEKPYAVVRGLPATISFNVSHSGKHGLVALAAAGRVGVDVEECTPHRNLDLLVDAVFTPAEQAFIALKAGTGSHRAFFKLWTVKEALLKALGTGFSLDASTFEVPIAIRRGASAAIFTFPHAPSEQWRVGSFGSEGYVAAVAHDFDPGSAMSDPASSIHYIAGWAT